MALSNKAEHALKALRGGALFVKRLEHQAYMNRSQFAHRLVLNGQVVRGYGFQTFAELEAAGLLVYAPGGTSVSTYYTATPEESK